MDRSSPLRARAAVRYVLQQLCNEGHCGFPEAGVMERTARLTGIAPEVVAAAVEQQLVDGALVRETWQGKAEAGHALCPDRPWLYLKPIFLAEVGVSRLVRELGEGAHPLPAVDADAALAGVGKQMDLTLAPAQAN